MATRRERVVLELQDDFSSGMAKAAAAAALLKRELNDLDGTSARTSKSMSPLGDPNGPIGRTGRQAEGGARSIDKFSGRLSLLVKAATVVAPALAPIGALAVPAVAGLAAQFGFAALAGGTAVAAFQGVGDALKVLNEARLDPTAENLEKARQAMHDLSPAARDAVVELRRFTPLLLEARDAAADGVLTGFVDALDTISTRMPDVERILSRVGDTVGDIMAAGATSLASDRWDEFFDFLATEAPSALSDMATAIGHVTHGLAELWMGLDPVNDQFSTWLVNVTRDFDAWAASLSQSDGFAEFIDYIQTNGPRVADALGAIGTAVLEIVEAIAPLGGASLKGLEIFAEVIGSIADSDLGTPILAAVTAMSALRLATLGWSSASTTAVGSFVAGQIAARDAIGQTYVKMAGLGKAAVAIGGLALASSDMGDSFDQSNTAALAMTGTMAGPLGFALGAVAGFTLDVTKANDGLEAALLRVRTAFESGSVKDQRAALEQLRGTTDKTAATFSDFGDISHLATFQLDGAKSLFLKLTGAIDGTKDELDQFHARIRSRRNMGQLLAAPLGLAEDAFEDADRAMRNFTKSFERLTGLLDRRQSLIDYERALDDLAKTAKDNEFNPDFEKGRRGLEKLNDLVDAAIGRSQTLRKEGDKLGAVRILRRAMDDLGEFGKRSPAAKRVVSDLIKELDRLDKKHTEPEIDADNKPAKNKVTEANSWLLDYGKRHPKAKVDADTKAAFDAFYQIERYKIPDKIVTIRGVNGGGFGPQEWATGGFTGMGGKYEPAGIVHRGEVVIPQERVKADWSFLKSRYGDLPGFAAGGVVGAPNDMRIGSPAQAAADGLSRLAHMTNEQIRAYRRELTERERLLEKELKHAESKFEAERDYLRELKDARHSLVEAVAGNFRAAGLGSDIDLATALRDGSLPSEVRAQVRAYANANGLAGSSIDEQIQAFLSSLSPDQLAAMQVQAQVGSASMSTRDASRFAELLAQLSGLGLDGAAYQSLAASGNIAQAQYLAGLTPDEIARIEQVFAANAQAAQQVGQQAGNAEFRRDIRRQTAVLVAARDDFREANQHLRRVTHRLAQVEKAIENLPKPVGREVGRAINDAAATATRS